MKIPTKLQFSTIIVHYLPITDAESLTVGGASVTAFNAAPPRILLKDARLLVVVANGRNP